MAGSFYPAQPQRLQAEILAYLAAVTSTGPVPKAIIAPHAGYIYSGPVAAVAYARLRAAADHIRRVVLIGPSHRVAFHGLALSQADAYATPLGNVPIDKTGVQQLLKLPFVHYLEQAHSLEHSLEVHLPFLQTVLQDFCLLPIVAGAASPEQVGQVLAACWGGAETLVVISSDLSHYHDYATAIQLDKATSAAIEALDYRHINPEAACGAVPVCGLLKLLIDKGMQIKTINLHNSGDTAGDKRRVVGYGAYVVT